MGALDLSEHKLSSILMEHYHHPHANCHLKGITYTLWLFNIAMENGPFIDDCPIKTSIYKGFSMAMLNNQMVPIFKQIHISMDWFKGKF